MYSTCTPVSNDRDESAKSRTNFRVRLDLKPAVTQMAFTPERKYGRRIIVANLLLFRIVPNAHSDVVIACSTGTYPMSLVTNTTLEFRYLPPDIEWQFKPSNQDALVELASSISQCMFT